MNPARKMVPASGVGFAPGWWRGRRCVTVVTETATLRAQCDYPPGMALRMALLFLRLALVAGFWNSGLGRRVALLRLALWQRRQGASLAAQRARMNDPDAFDDRNRAAGQFLVMLGALVVMLVLVGVAVLA